jgi:predicted lipoprotein with Yx(FWY)xxD motif
MRLAVPFIALTLLSVACGGLSEAPGIPTGVDIDDDEDEIPDANTPEPPEEDSGTEDAGVPVVDAGEPVDDEIPGANVRLRSNDAFDGYLTDAKGRALYMYVEDLAGSRKTACLNSCAVDFAPFDALELVAGNGLDEKDFVRFHRDDGAWQQSYKGHPLYYRTDEVGSTEVTGDGTRGLWYVARDYSVFRMKRKDVAPLGNGLFGTPFLTDGLGRALYVYLTDTPGDASTAPVSTCEGECLVKWPVWSSDEDITKTIMPSSFGPELFGVFEREDGTKQLTFRGFPLYYFLDDDLPGEAAGHNQGEWRVVDPLTFAPEAG